MSVSRKRFRETQGRLSRKMRLSAPSGTAWKPASPSHGRRWSASSPLGLKLAPELILAIPLGKGRGPQPSGYLVLHTPSPPASCDAGRAPRSPARTGCRKRCSRPFHAPLSRQPGAARQPYHHHCYRERLLFHCEMTWRGHPGSGGENEHSETITVAGAPALGRDVCRGSIPT